MKSESISSLRDSKHLNPDFRPEFNCIIGKQYADNDYLKFMCEKFTRDDLSARELFRYGLENLPNNAKRPNMKLSAYFLVLSEIKNLAHEVKGFAIDLMVYCENGSDGPDSLRPDLIGDEFRRIEPMLS